MSSPTLGRSSGRFSRSPLTLSPGSVTKADAKAVVAAGWDGEALYYAVAVPAFPRFHE